MKEERKDCRMKISLFLKVYICNTSNFPLFINRPAVQTTEDTGKCSRVVYTWRFMGLLQNYVLTKIRQGYIK